MVWPELEAPLLHENPVDGWKEPSLPDIKKIWKVARECGYAVGVHGSLKRDFDLIAAPWTEEALCSIDLIDALCEAMNAVQVGRIAAKPHGRIGAILQIDGYVKAIDISIMPIGNNQPIQGDVKRCSDLIHSGLIKANNKFCQFCGADLRA